MKPERYSMFMKWYLLLETHEKDKVDRLTNFLLNCTDQHLIKLEGETIIRKQSSTKNLKDFYQEEIENISEKILSYPLNNQLELSKLFGFVRHEIITKEISLNELWFKPGDIELNCINYESLGIRGLRKIQEFNTVLEILAHSQYLFQLWYVLEMLIDIDKVKKSTTGPKDNQLLQILTHQIINSSELSLENNETFIERERLSLIYRHFKESWHESEDDWIDRFALSNKKIQDIKLDKEAVPGSNRLLLLAILDSIFRKKQIWLAEVDIPLTYEDFVHDRFGLHGYKKALSYIKNNSQNDNTRREFDKISDVCNRILEI